MYLLKIKLFISFSVFTFNGLLLCEINKNNIQIKTILPLTKGINIYSTLKAIKILPGGESNPGLPRDRRGY